MTEQRKPKKILPKPADNAYNKSAEDLICIPRDVYEQMMAEIKAIKRNGGRLEALTADLPKTK